MRKMASLGFRKATDFVLQGREARALYAQAEREEDPTAKAKLFESAGAEARSAFEISPSFKVLVDFYGDNTESLKRLAIDCFCRAALAGVGSPVLQREEPERHTRLLDAAVRITDELEKASREEKGEMLSNIAGLRYHLDQMVILRAPQRDGPVERTDAETQMQGLLDRLDSNGRDAPAREQIMKNTNAFHDCAHASVVGIHGDIFVNRLFMYLSDAANTGEVASAMESVGKVISEVDVSNERKLEIALLAARAMLVDRGRSSPETVIDLIELKKHVPEALRMALEARTAGFVIK